MLSTAVACTSTSDSGPVISAEAILGHIETLASDEFEGRLPGTPGEEKTVRYLIEQYKALGLEPGNPDGTYVQAVPLVGITTTSEATVTAGGKPLALTNLDDYVAVTSRVVESVAVEDSEIVFVGYGIEVPEHDRNDYKDIDVAGKTIIMLVNDPGLENPDVFRGRTMTYYGRWTYKYEIASAKGAAAAIIVHETEPAGYPWEVVRQGWSGERFDIKPADQNRTRVPVEGWVTRAKAEELFAAGGLDFDALREQAQSKEFQPVALNATASFQLENTMREVDSQNVVAKISGARESDEYVVYSAHWDHMGTDPTIEGDGIFNGAEDNASGIASMLEIARAFKTDPAPRRSILFLAVTAEEQGLLGAKWYGQNPLYPLTKTLANINMDGANLWGRTSDVVVVGLGNSTLDDLAIAAAADQDRTVKPDSSPEKGFYYRSDHFEFAKQGVPALYSDTGVDYIDKPEGYGDEKRKEYIAEDYHKPSDEVKPDWDLAGAVDDAEWLYEIGRRVVEADEWPQWKDGIEFKAVREQTLESQTN